MDGRPNGDQAVGAERVSRLLCLCDICTLITAAFVFSEDPKANKYCHCEDCQRLHGEKLLLRAIIAHTPRCAIPARRDLYQGRRSA